MTIEPELRGGAVVARFIVRLEENLPLRVVSEVYYRGYYGLTLI